MSSQAVLHICEQFVDLYKDIANRYAIDNIELKGYPCQCLGKTKHWSIDDKDMTASQERHHWVVGGSACSYHVTDGLKLEGHMSFDSCLAHLIPDELVNRLVGEKAYLVTEVWLKNWQSHLANMGLLDRKRAIDFFAPFTEKVVLLTLEAQREDDQALLDFASYIDQPYSIIMADEERLLKRVRGLSEATARK